MILDLKRLEIYTQQANEENDQEQKTPGHFLKFLTPQPSQP